MPRVTSKPRPKESAAFPAAVAPELAPLTAGAIAARTDAQSYSRG